MEWVRYFHLNPLRGSWVKNFGELDRYPWSGHRILSREYGISLAEIARRVGVCTSAIGKAIQKMEGKCHRCKNSTTPPLVPLYAHGSLLGEASPTAGSYSTFISLEPQIVHEAV